MPALGCFRSILPLLLVLLAACGESLTTAELLARSRAALAAGEYNAATIDAKSALQQEPRSPEGRRLLGDIAMATASFAEAAEEYDKALSFGRDPETAADLAVALIEGTQYRRLLDEALDGQFEGLESNGIVLAALANAEAATGNIPAAKDLIAKAIVNTADDPFVRLIEARLQASIDGDVDGARSQAESLTTDYPEYASGFSLLANIATLQGDHEAAVNAFAQTVEINPLRVRDHLGMIAALLAIPDFERGQVEVDKLDRLIPNNPLLSFYQGRLALSDGRIEEGLVKLDATLADIPAHPGALYFAGMANLQQGNMATAESQLADFLSSNSSNIEARLALGRLYLEEGRAEEARSAANVVLARIPDNESALKILAASMSLSGEHAESAGVYARLLESGNEPDADSRARYGAALVRSGNEAGIAELEKARDMDPTNELARRLLVASYLAKGDIELANKEAEAYRDAAKSSSVPLVLLAQVAAFTGDENTAEEALDLALDIDPAASDAVLGKARLAMSKGDFDAAERVYRDALAINPGEMQSLMGLAAVQSTQGKLDDMVATLERAIELDEFALAPRLVLARHLLKEKEFGRGVSLLTEIREEHAESPDLHQLLAGGFMALGEMDSALASAEDLLALRPANARALQIAAVTAQGDKQFDKAERYITKALEIDPDDAVSRSTLVELYMLQNKLPELSELLAELPDEVQQQRDVRLARGRVELMQGKSDEALGFLLPAHEMRPDSASVFLLVSAYLQAGNNPGAESVAESWLKQSPDDPAILQQYSTYLLAHGRDVTGANYLERLYALAPEDVVVLNNLAWAYRVSDTPRAIELADKAVAAAPDNMSILDTRSVVFMNAGRLDDALADNDRALRIAPGFPQVLFHRGQILVKMGRDAEAIAALEKTQRAKFAEGEEAEALLRQLKAKQ